MDHFIECLKALGLGFLVVTFWQLLEILIEGQITPNEVDSIIGVFLVISLYFNLKTLESIRRRDD